MAISAAAACTALVNVVPWTTLLRKGSSGAGTCDVGNTKPDEAPRHRVEKKDESLKTGGDFAVSKLNRCRAATGLLALGKLRQLVIVEFSHLPQRRAKGQTFAV